MILTREEAEDKYCCGPPECIYCVVDDCVAWRWFDDKEYQGERRGFCGLAGEVKVI